jgi:polar amino acid transport system substrate-binding protein
MAQAEEVRLLRFAMSAESPPTSYAHNGEAQGILRDMLLALFANLPQYRLEFISLPWSRAQLEVTRGQADGFCTFPSEKRKGYARFAARPVYVWDYGNLVYHRDNPRSARIASATSFDDLRDLRLISQEGVDWEIENVPGFIQRYSVNTPPQMIHMLLRRGAGDFLIMSAEQAHYYASRFGYTEQLRNAKVDFIPNSQVPFHIGLRQSLPDIEQIMAHIDQAMVDPAFQVRQEQIILQYRVAGIR